MADKLDYKKEYKDLYLPPKKPVLIDVPKISFIMADGSGAPEGEEYQRAISVLYALTFTIKMSKMGGRQPEGYFEYVVPPLEGLWGGPGFDINDRKNWVWTSMIRQPEFVTKQVFEGALAQAAEKKPDIDFSGARFDSYTEGKCVQIMHIGPYSEEPASIDKMRSFAAESGYAIDLGATRRHHEIYLSDPRRSNPKNLKTVIRLPVRPV